MSSGPICGIRGNPLVAAKLVQIQKVRRLKARYEDIVSTSAIGQKNPLPVNELMRLAANEPAIPITEDEDPVLVLGIDVQNDFMEHGELPVPGSHGDVQNFTRFIYDNLPRITKIAVSLDTHQPRQVFHAAWWMNSEGREPAPFTTITLDDINQGKWMARYSPPETREYVAMLEGMGKKQLMIWPYHCLQGTFGAALEGQFSNVLYFHAAVRQTQVLRVVKGLDPLSEMYGIVKPEYDRAGYINHELLNEVAKYKRILIGGEAQSHCVLESVIQLTEHFSQQPEITERIFILEDCMSPIDGFADSTRAVLSGLESKYGIQRVLSSEFKL